MKLLVLGDYDSPHVKRWITEMEARGWVVQCLSFTSGIDVPGRIAHLGKIRAWNLLFQILRVRRLSREFGPDIVHAHYATSYGFLGSFICGVPFVVSLWGSDILVSAKQSSLLRRFARRTLWKANHVFADSDELLEEAEKVFPIRDKSTKVHWGVDHRFFYPIPRTARKLRILSFRNHYPVYNVDLILGAFRKVFENHEEAELLLAGVGSMTGELRGMAGGPADIRFLGRLQEPDLARLIQECDVVVTVPSTDGLSSSLLEAMACGKYVICSDIPVYHEWLKREYASFVAPGSGSALEAAFLFVKKCSAEQLEKMGRAAFEANQSRLGREEQFDRVVRIYGNLKVVEPSPQREKTIML
ncbi:MAG: glycosyltransferase family 4 protein [Bdellovibrionaceae bacterium]|nr:glycosyltransferase family 4 protein [Pseudobdellovibrionaceae bacterium]